MSEILGVLFKYLLAMLAIVAVVVVLYEALGSSKTATAAADMSQIQANIYQLYTGSNSSTPAALPSANLVGSGVLPASMVSSGTLVNPFDGTLSTASSPTISVAGTPAKGSVLGLTFISLTPSNCAKLATASVNAGASISTGSATTVTASLSDVSSGALGANVAKACTPSNGTSSITINFYPSSAASAAVTDV